MDEAVKEIIDAIVRFGQPKKIILFGSRSRGGENAGSDVDIAALYEGLDANPFETAVLLRTSLLAATSLPVDLLVYDASDFERRARRVSSLESIIAREGVLAYG